MSTFDSETVKELVTELQRLNREIETIKEQRTTILDDYKDRLDIKLFKAALRIAKIRQGVQSDEELDSMVGASEE